MRHRQTTGAGPSGTRPSIAILLLAAVGGGLAVGLGQPAGAWAGYGASSVAAVLGFGALWQQRGLLERWAKEMAKRRRADLDALAVAEHRHRAELERLRTELEHEQQYSVLVQDQLARAREQLEREREGRRDAERELDALTGSDGQRSALPSLVLTVEEPARQQGEGPRTVSALEAGERPRQSNSAARRRGWQVVDGDADGHADGDAGVGAKAPAAQADRLYRPFTEQLVGVAVPVSEAALAMAPVIGASEMDGMLDLTAYDETVEFSVREIKDMA